MSRPFEALHETLLKAGVAPRHARRYERELTEHLDDLIVLQKARGYEGEDAELRARALLGPDDELVQAMLARRQFRSLSARAPWLVFTLAPPFVVAGLLMSVGFTMIGVWRFLLGGQIPSGAGWLPDAVALWCSVVTVGTGPLAAIFFTIIALRQRLPLRWPLTAVGIVAVLAASMTFAVKLPLPHLHKAGEMTLGLSIGEPFWGNLARFCLTVAIAIGTSVVLRTRRSLA